MRARAFSLVELMVVVLVLGIIAAIAIPQFARATDDARVTAVESTVTSVRSALAGYRTAAVIAGEDPFPTLSQMTDGTALRFDLPANPYTGVAGVQSVSRSQADRRAVVNSGRAGWNYFVDNAGSPPVAIFYANSDDATGRIGSDGAELTANEL